MEGAAGLELAAAGLLERHPAVDELDDVRAGHEVVDEALGDAAGHVIKFNPKRGCCKVRRTLPIVILIALLLAALAAWLGWRWWQRRRREALSREPLPAEYAAVLERRVPAYRGLPPELRRSLQGLVNVFLDEKHFTGCDGLAVTDEMRLTVAGNACLLLLGRGRVTFPGFRTILVYPNSFVSPQTEYDGLVEIRHHDVRSGESWQRGPVVLAWSEIEEDIQYPDGDRNVILHEFAHKLDEENDSVDGLPVLRDPAQQREWARVLTAEYEALQREVEAGIETFLDPYGAESPAEFFAVITETFFQMPGVMREEMPELYGQLSRFYGLDPAGW